MREALKNNLYMLSFLSKHCPAYIVIVILKALLTAISSVANVYIFKFILDALTSHYDIGFIILFIFTLFFVNLLCHAFNSICTKWLLPRYSQIIHKNIQVCLFERTAGMSFELYDDMSFYNKFTFALQETEKRGFAVLASFSKLVSCIFSIIGFVSLMASVEYKLFIVVILCVVATFFLNKHIAKAQHMFDLESVQSKREARYIGRVNYLREYAQDLKLHGFSALEELYIKANDKLIGL